MKGQFKRSADISYFEAPKKIDVDLNFYRPVNPELLDEGLLESTDDNEDWIIPFQTLSLFKPSILAIASPWLTLPWELRELDECLARSKYLISLQEDWDGEGGIPYSHLHWSRVVSFLATQALWLWKTLRVILDNPSIIAGPRGTIDVHWKTIRAELLINFPVESEKSANFYGDDYGRNPVKGSLDLSSDNHWIVLWLMERKRPAGR